MNLLGAYKKAPVVKKRDAEAVDGGTATIADVKEDEAKKKGRVDSSPTVVLPSVDSDEGDGEFAPPIRKHKRALWS